MATIEELGDNVLRVVQNAEREGEFLQSFLGDPAGDATYTVVNSDGTTSTATVPNIAKFVSSVEDAFLKTYYVDQDTGSDNNTGLSAGSPFETIEKAISLTLVGGSYRINIAVSISPYILASRYDVSGKSIHFRATSLVAPYVIIESVQVGDDPAQSGGFTCGQKGNGKLLFQNIILKTADIPHVGFKNHFFDATYGKMDLIIDNNLLYASNVTLDSLFIRQCPFAISYLGLGSVDLSMRQVRINEGVAYAKPLLTSLGNSSVNFQMVTVINGTPMKELITGKKYYIETQPQNIVSNISLA